MFEVQREIVSFEAFLDEKERVQATLVVGSIPWGQQQGTQKTP